MCFFGVRLRKFLAFRRLSQMTQCAHLDEYGAINLRIWKLKSPFGVTHFSHLLIEIRSQSVDSEILYGQRDLLSTNAHREREWQATNEVLNHVLGIVIKTALEVKLLRIQVSGFRINACRLRRVSLSLTECQQEIRNQQRMKREISEI